MRTGTRVLKTLADWAWPPQCPLTGESVARNGELTGQAWYALTFLDAPWCAACGLPFPYPGASGSAALAQCAGCIAKPPVFDAARAPLAYDEISKRLVLGFKHGGRRELIDRFGQWMALAGASELAQAGAAALAAPVCPALQPVGPAGRGDVASDGTAGARRCPAAGQGHTQPGGPVGGLAATQCGGGLPGGAAGPRP